MIQIDGSIFEGGGQIFRMSIALSYLLKKPVSIYNIRANRPNPGLSHQHLTGLNSFLKFSQSQILNACIRSKEVQFQPCYKDFGDFQIDQKTPGAISLIFQMILPCLIFQNKITVQISGAVNTSFSPLFHSISDVLRPILKQMSVDFDYNYLSLEMKKQMGQIQINIYPTKNIKKIEMIERGLFEGINIFIIYNPLHEQHKEQLIKSLKNNYNILNVFEQKAPVDQIVFSSKLIYQNITGLHCNALITNKNFDTQLKTINQSLDELIQGKYCLDEYITDQILIFMALAKGKSSISTPNQLSLHTQAVLEIIKVFTGTQINIRKQIDFTVVEIEGIDYQFNLEN